MSDEYLKAIRQFELKALWTALPRAPRRVLEVGAGAGWQAELLLQAGYELEALEMVGHAFSSPVIPIRTFDGVTFPFAAGEFDMVFTSNVLDHTRDWQRFSTEVRRVLRGDGRWITVLPTTTWRAWTFALYYLTLPRWLLARRRQRRRVLASASNVPLPPNPPLPRNFKFRVLPPRLGERGHSLSELVLFSHRRRLRFFAEHGWRVVESRPLPLFYSGARLLGPRLSLTLRQRLAAVLGSSCRAYVLTKSS